MDELSILIIDDEETQLKSLSSFLIRRKYTVFTSTSGPEGYDIAKSNQLDLVFSDFRMPEWDGLTVVKKLKELNPDIDIVVMTAFGNIEDAVRIMKAGAYDYLSKPVDLDEFENIIKRVKEKRILIKENKVLREQLSDKFKFDAIISHSGEMEDVLNTAARVANSKANVLIRGESGTGKELIARAIHFASERKNKPFVVVNMAAITETLIESELFGHEKGAYTGANQRRIGRFEQANGGSLFIDEVGDIPLSVQVKLLRVIQFGQFERLGGSETQTVEVRIITATHRDLEEMIKESKFREDLFYRLNVISIRIPPLRARRIDIPPLVNHFLLKYSKENNKDIKGISQEGLDKLVKYSFPGNIRELENLIEHAVIMCRSDYITQADFPPELSIIPEKSILDPANLDHGYDEKLKSFEIEMISQALEDQNGNQSAAARTLGITERHLRSRLKILGLK
jgi:two-component system NtrC family response regulator